MKTQPDFEKKWGKVCPVCKKRKTTIYAKGSAEGGKNSVCNCSKVDLSLFKNKS